MSFLESIDPSPLLAPIDEKVVNLADLSGLPETGVRLLLIYFITFPVSLGFRMQWINRHAYSIIVGLSLQYFLFREGTLHFILMCIIVKILIHSLSREIQPGIIFCAALCHSTFYLTVEAIYRYGNTDLNYTMYVMFLCQKLSTLGFCYRDGMAKYEADLDAHGRRCRIYKIPTFYEILSYATYPCTSYVGPAFEFKDYKDFIEQQKVYRNIPFHFMKGFSKYMKGIPCLLVVMVTGAYVKQTDLGDPKLGEYGFFKQTLFCFLVLWNFKYSGYACWFFADGTNILSGFAMTVFFTSAFWHGFLPCYYLFFFSLDLLLSASRKIHKNQELFNFLPPFVRKVLGFILTQFFIAHLGCIYLARTGDNIWNFNKSTNFIGLSLLGAGYLITKFTMGGGSKKSKGKSADKTKAD